MILNSDLILYHPLWEKADNELCGKDGIGLFNRLIDVYILACAIGVKEDKTVTEYEMPLSNPKSIGRNTYMSPTNVDLSNLLSFMLQNILLNSKTISLEMDERLKLAFDPDYNINKLRATELLNAFANYGIEQIFSRIDSVSPLVAVEEIHSYFEEMSDTMLDDILKTITLDELKI